MEEENIRLNWWINALEAKIDEFEKEKIKKEEQKQEADLL